MPINCACYYYLGTFYECLQLNGDFFKKKQLVRIILYFLLGKIAPQTARTLNEGFNNEGKT